jgi:hypothetical protein
LGKVASVDPESGFWSSGCACGDEEPRRANNTPRLSDLGHPCTGARKAPPLLDYENWIRALRKNTYDDEARRYDQAEIVGHPTWA